MRYSKWKLNAVAACIRGKSLFDAKRILAGVDKKGARFVRSLLDELEESGISRGRTPELMYVRTITVGGSILQKLPDIKGRGRCGVIRIPSCSMRMVLEEKHPAEFYKMIVKGETPSGLAAILRRTVY